MYGLFIEQRKLNGDTSLSWDIAHHMYPRQLRGNIAIVTEEPEALLSAVKKQWNKVIRQVQNERSSTTDASRILELTHEIARMQSLAFTAESPAEDPQADVLFATAAQFVDTPPICHTLYVTYPVERLQLRMLGSWMPVHGLWCCTEGT